MKILSMLLIGLMVSGCTSTDALNDDTFVITTSFNPITLLTNEITKDAKNVLVESLESEGVGCLHDYTLTTNDMKKIENTDVLIINGAGMESSIEKAISGVSNIIDTSVGIDILVNDYIHTHEDECCDEDHTEEHVHEDDCCDEEHVEEHVHEDDCCDEEHVEEHVHEDDCCDEEHIEEHVHEDDCCEEEHTEEHVHEDDCCEEEHTEEHVHSEDCDHEINPHIWLNIENAINQAENIANELIKLNPENEKVYTSNLESLKIELESLDKRFEDELSNVKNNNIVTFHNSFVYLADAYNLNIVSNIQDEENQEVSAKKIEEIIDLINTNEVKSIFTEEQFTQNTVDVIQKETNTNVYILDTMTLKNDKTYVEAMEYNLSILKEALNYE
ncbi:MAG: metal ABC transporter substrate-binding protein [Peptostreptococcaceae bacterium]